MLTLPLPASLALLGGAGGVWTPLDLGAALAAWWSAADHGTARMTDDGAGLISSWSDRIAAIALTATGTARPTWSAGAVNGTPGVAFDGVVNTLVNTTLGAYPSGATAGEMWVAAVTTKPASGQTHMSHYGGTSGATGRRFSLVSVGSVRVSDGATVIDATIADGYHVLGGAWSGTVMTGRVDGAPFATTGTIATLATGTTRDRLCAQNGTSAGAWANAVIAHRFLITGLLSLADQQRLEGWCAWNAGLASILPAAHPYRQRRP